jgi:adenylate cyclase
MTRRAARLVMSTGVLPVAAAALICLARPALLRHIEYSGYDVMLRTARTRPPSDRIAIVDVDERSLSAIGQWPWRRDIVGELIAELRNFGAAAIALDIVFAEPDRYDGTGPTPDAVLADTLRGGRVVLGYALTFEGASNQTHTCVDHALGLPVVRREDDHGEAPFFTATGAVCNLHALTRAAAGSGFMNAAPDPDGLLRRVPLLAELGGRVYPSLALAAVSAATQPSDAVLRVANVNTSLLRFNGASVPLDGKSNLLVRFRGPKRTFPYVSAVDVLTGDVPAGTLDGKIVFVGTTALGTREVVSTPLDTLFTGVEVQATVADNLLQGDFLHRSEHGVGLEAAAAIGLGLVPILIVAWSRGLVAAAIGTALCLIAAWGGAVWLMSANGTYVSPLFPTLALSGELALMTAASLVLEHRRADRASAATATSQRLMIETLLSLTDIRDVETGKHSRRIQEYTRLLANQLALDPGYRPHLTPERIELLATLGPLHDIGKIGVPDHLLKKPGPLTADELLQVRTHPVQGREAIVNAQRQAGVHDDVALDVAKDIVYTHHERWNGSGYPQGLRGTEIPIAGRVIALVDVYDALRSRRPYQEPRSHEDTVHEIVKGRGTQFDPAVVDAFVRVSEPFRRLSDAELMASQRAD